ncbi:hypothetical protein [Pseudanabaena sp. PCC 6802]|uniref:hypothetical protein n=1 Tax=Pseudanabaena sp. PCC 6802 TaxID=118173 RepID=UPI000348F205|nr:hypothetical protein [Pseudanabaena sp. PCC 6802]
MVYGYNISSRTHTKAIDEKGVTLCCANWDDYRAIALALDEKRSIWLAFKCDVVEVMIMLLEIHVYSAILESMVMAKRSRV